MKGILIGAFSLAAPVLSQQSVPAPLEIQDGKLFGCAWLDGTRDTTVGWNRKTKYNSAAFQLAQQIPLDYANNIVPAPAWRLSETGTDAYLVLTVYNDKGIEAITDSDIEELAGQINELNKIGRKVFLRLMPEMNGNWFPYGQKPTAYIALFRKIITRIRQVSQYGIFASVWSPNNGQGYPFSSTKASSDADFALMDTNKDGVLDIKDNPYSPFYPGDSYVDWVGLSVYHKGQVYSSTTGWSDNSNAAADQFDKFLNGAADDERGTKGIPYGQFKFYDVYAKEKNKPFMISEAGAAFHENSPTGDNVGEISVKQSWWRLAQTNRTITKAYPKLKLYCQFEETKPEEFGIKNNYHLTSNPEVLAAFIKDFQLASSMYVFANFTNCTRNQIGASLPGSSCNDPNENGSDGKGNGSSANGLGFMFLVGVLVLSITSLSRF